MLQALLYGEGPDITEDSILMRCLSDADAPAEALSFRHDEQIKAVLKAKSDEALLKGVFGSSFFIWRDEPFWGADRIAMLIDWVRAHCP